MCMAGGQTVEADEQLRGADGVITAWKTYKFPCFDSSGNLLSGRVGHGYHRRAGKKAGT